MGNRDGERILADIDFLSVVAWRLLGIDPPDLSRLRAGVLRDTPSAIEAAEKVLGQLLDPLGAIGVEMEGAMVPINTTPFDRREVVRGHDDSLVFVDAPSHGVGVVEEGRQGVVATKREGKITLENEFLRVVFSPTGEILSLLDKDAERDAVLSPGHFLRNSKRWRANRSDVKIDPTGLRAEVDFDGRMSVAIESGARGVKLLPAEDAFTLHLPLAITARRFTVAAGQSWIDHPASTATIAQGWIDYSEHGFGLAAIAAEPFAASIEGDLLQADMPGEMILLPHLDDWREARLLEEFSRLRHPILWGRQWGEIGFYARVEDENLILGHLAPAKDGRGVMLTLKEIHGARGSAVVRSCLLRRKAVLCDEKERALENLKVDDGTITVAYLPEQQVYVRLI